LKGTKRPEDGEQEEFEWQVDKSNAEDWHALPPEYARGIE
jgi:hypothetical protein